MKPSIQKALRNGTTLLIEFDTRIISLVPHQRTEKPGGVYDNEIQPPRAPQEFYIEPAVTAVAGMPSEGAKHNTWSYYLVGHHDCEMEINDTWMDGDMVYRIIAIQPYNGYERRALVAVVGNEPNYGV
jgi:hypothetical protein